MSSASSNMRASTKKIYELFASLKQTTAESAKYTTESMELIKVYRYIVNTVGDDAVEGAVPQLPHVGLKLVTF